MIFEFPGRYYATVRLTIKQRTQQMKKIMLSFFILTLSGCYTSYKPSVEFLYNSPNGPVYEAYCSTSGYTIGTCYKLANQQCMGRANIIDKSEHSYSESSYDTYYKEMQGERYEKIHK